MKPDSIADLRETYGRYVDGYRDAGGALPDMMQLKLTHTEKVVESAIAIAKGEGFDARTSLACEAAALLHDTGRYEQLRVYNTFRDSDSVDHAVFSHDIVEKRGWLDGWTDRDAILDAVLYHNRRDIPADVAEGLPLACARTVRDADKLDIFRVLEDRVRNTQWRTDSRAFWQSILKTVNQNKICGVAPIYCLLRLLELLSRASGGQLLSYEQAVDEETRSCVSFASIVLGMNNE